jgi:hypothetical protein
MAELPVMSQLGDYRVEVVSSEAKAAALIGNERHVQILDIRKIVSDLQPHLTALYLGADSAAPEPQPKARKSKRPAREK